MPIPPHLLPQLERLKQEFALKAELDRMKQMAVLQGEKVAQAPVTLPTDKKAEGGQPSLDVMRLAIGGQGPRNFLKGSVEKVVQPLKQDVLNEEGLRNLEARTGAENANAYKAERAADYAINKWIESNLANYIRKQMASPNDPIRKLAEQGVLHMNPELLEEQGRHGEDRRQMLGGLQMAQSPHAQAWENATDSVFEPNLVEDILGIPDIYKGQQEPWMQKVNPKTPVYELYGADQLGFDHIVDILKQDLAEGRIRPEQLSKVSIEQAVRRVHEYDQERKKAMAQTALKATEGMPVHKDYGDGFKWIELTLPKELPEGWSKKELPTGRQAYFDPEGEGSEHPGMKSLESALKYEGDTMGHCVGGYCPDVAQGKSRIFSLRDKNNEPHVTIEVQPHPIKTWDHVTKAVGPEKAGQLWKEFDQMHGYKNNAPEQAFDEFIKSKGIEQPMSIKQIKGKQNAKPKAPYIPYVQDFVRSGKWSQVGDIKNTELIRKSDLIDKFSPEELDAVGKGEYLTPGEHSDLLLSKLQPTGQAPKDGPVKMAAGGKAEPTLAQMKLALNDMKMYSPLHKAVLGVPRTKGTPAEFMAEASKQPGYRKEEVEDRKIELPDQKMTKQEFLAHLGKYPATNVIVDDRSADDGDTEHDEWTLPGGYNYREILLKRPAFSYQNELMATEANLRRENDPFFRQRLQERVNQLRAIKDRVGDQFNGVQAHFGGTPNILASLRVKDRMGPNGEKILHVEEIQSDWHQQGRKGGYKDQSLEKQAQQKLDEYEKDARERLRQIMLAETAGEMSGERAKQFVDGKVNGMDAGSLARMLNEGDIFNNLYQTYREAVRSPGVPPAPFKTSWHELALKHALTEAVKGGYHGIAITPGEEQADRYDLSKYVQALYYSPGDKRLLGTTDEGQELFRQYNVNPEDLDKHIGPEPAKKLLSAPLLGGEHSLTSQDLKVGGAGMKGFYDKVVPNFLNKLGKPHGAQVQMHTMPVTADKSKNADADDELLNQLGVETPEVSQTKLHYFPITDSLRNQIKTQGLPQYEHGGEVDMEDYFMGQHKAKGGSTIKKVEDYLRDREGQYGLKRLQRAADEIPGLEKMYSLDALQRAFSGDNAKALMTMDPADFEKFALRLGSEEDEGGYENGMTRAQYLAMLMKIAQKSGFADVPFLEVNRRKPEYLPNIEGHEGRHRSRALAGSGTKKSLVQLYPSPRMREPMPRRYREDFIEAMKKELGEKRLVTPETRSLLPADLTSMEHQNLERRGLLAANRPQLPEIYKDGGSVESVFFPESKE